MSRYTFDGEPGTVYWQVGWDHPMWTYFAQRYRVGRGDEPEVWIVGADPQIVTPEDLEAAMGVPIPAEIRRQLADDQLASAENPGPTVGSPEFAPSSRSPELRRAAARAYLRWAAELERETLL